jgi:hypothetical protein
MNDVFYSATGGIARSFAYGKTPRINVWSLAMPNSKVKPLAALPTVLESRRYKYNFRLHASSLAQNGARVNGVDVPTKLTAQVICYLNQRPRCKATQLPLK